MSSWLRNSPLRVSSRLRRPALPAPAADPAACYESFCHHWRQAELIIKHQQQGAHVPSHDDISAVVNHLEYLATLLLLEIRQISGQDDANESSNATFGSSGPCLDQLLSENLLDKLYEWGNSSGRYMNVVRLEQIKLYSLLVQHFGKQLLCAEPFLRPLLKLLCSFRVDITTPDLEGKLICLLGQICVVLMQNPHFVDLFFFPPPQDDRKEQSQFVPVTLLLTHVHREDSSGQQARAALLLCAAFSARNKFVAEFIENRSNVCLVLAGGLSALYSSLPRKIEIAQADWHRLTPDDVNDINKLGIFMNSLEFCNAVAQVSHPSIRHQLLHFVYQGFLLPVMGPALLQSGVEEQIAAIAYLELSLRSVSDPGLLKSLVRFLMDKNYDETNILDNVIPFINGDPRLSIVTISLLETLIDLNCEDLMLELVLKYLIDGNHLMVSHRHRSLDCDVHCKGTTMLLSLSPDCCSNRPQVPLLFRKNSFAGSRKLSICSVDQNMSSLTSVTEESIPMTNSLSPTSSAYGLNANESLYGNYHAYLCEARRKILSCKKSCSKWSSTYDGFCDSSSSISPKPADSNTIIEVVKKFQLEHSNLVKETSDGSGELSNDNIYTQMNKEEDSLHSIGESSGYESFKYKGDDSHSSPDNEESTAENGEFAENSFWKISDVEHLPKISHNSLPVALSKNSHVTSHPNNVNIGPLLTNTLEKLSKMLSNNVYVNLRLTGLLTRLATYPLPLLRSFLLCPWIVLQPTITSLYQILLSIKQEIDESVLNDPECYRLLEDAQTFLIDREIRLANTRKNAIESTSTKNTNPELGKNALSSSQFSTHSLQFTSGDTSQPNSGNWEQPSNVQPMSVSEPFKRNEPKRRSFSSSITSMFSRKITSGASGIAAIYEYVTNGILSSSPNSNTAIDSPPRSSPETLIQSSLTEDNLWHSTKTRRTVLNALILDEWIKELGALAQEHVVCSISDLIHESSTNELMDLTIAQTKYL
ncbi:FHIP family protein GJ17503-like isoform X2 [Arctopsyche grandis]|uniref:FHIP family protein GJ17503-like isoform X2 n=1 Tax=Arctopsyche grandis TaxID=121162 RepID=UPI00406D86FC